MFKFWIDFVLMNLITHLFSSFISNSALNISARPCSFSFSPRTFDFNLPVSCFYFSCDAVKTLCVCLNSPVVFARSVINRASGFT